MRKQWRENCEQILAHKEEKDSEIMLLKARNKEGSSRRCSSKLDHYSQHQAR